MWITAYYEIHFITKTFLRLQKCFLEYSASRYARFIDYSEDFVVYVYDSYYISNAHMLYWYLIIAPVGTTYAFVYL